MKPQELRGWTVFGQVGDVEGCRASQRIINVHASVATSGLKGSSILRRHHGEVQPVVVVLRFISRWTLVMFNIQITEICGSPYNKFCGILASMRSNLLGSLQEGKSYIKGKHLTVEQEFPHFNSLGTFRRVLMNLFLQHGETTSKTRNQ
ncbi:hypothetical protein AVEN_237311-1 [Araneus ventricosus]|uniref:Uncharacterized protein n=1 Tax=Araneus ventricosus TaxID=182803 RepID=A0A4Y2UKD6_ARAVE|nr:hypothetical protein AVEN_237311-1 [Araneus ventricosus]